ncbi:Endoribonuclease L-PSP [Rubrobacter xylanophilus DSM 9941]|uniref:Endoribonuclease L-PSP n=1 Tax=Rubrobacter xylanophilus (strain DSM 9941 / JCM 11954 / NBRC 16129 / PRD-1) TaxID=266117 RepID=Q1AWL2_RUBXD|nr:RidA family protein [Rubrobacter xylanophilus]ABG04216.1 Endoribonuclease L-PSP [Rubrobacter xylanophilus DSM 9941]
MQDPHANLERLGYELPDVPSPAGSYVPAVRSNGMIFTAGQVPFRDGKLAFSGKVGGAVSLEEAQEAARICALNALAAAAAEAGGLQNIARIVKVVGFVASAPGFNQQPQVLNGASDLLGEIFGEAGLHARSAIGVAELPLDAPVEVELVAEVRRPS